MKIDVGNGIVVTSSITNEAVDDSASPRATSHRGHQGVRRLRRKMKLNWVATAALSLAVIAPELLSGEVAEPPVLQGAVKQQLVLDEVLLKSLPATTVDVNYETGEGKKSASYTGVLLWALLVKSGPIDGSGQKCSAQAHAVDHGPRWVWRGGGARRT